jgi:hypothetical protein
MSEVYKVRIVTQDGTAYQISLDGPLKLGRQRNDELDKELYKPSPASGAGQARLLIAPRQDKDNITRRHLTLTPLLGGLVRIANHSQAPLPVDDESIPPAAPDFPDPSLDRAHPSPCHFRAAL